MASINPALFLNQINEVPITRIAELKPFVKNCNCRVIILSKDGGKVSKDGSMVWEARGADDSGSIIMTLFNRTGELVKPGDIIMMTGGFVTMFRGTMRLACKLGTVVRLGRVTMSFQEQPDVSAWEWMPNPANEQELIRKAEPKKPKDPRKRAAE